MNLERIREELRRLSALVDGWSDDGRIAALERDLALEKLRELYESLRFDVEPVAGLHAAEPIVAAVPVSLDLDDILSLDTDMPDADWTIESEGADAPASAAGQTHEEVVAAVPVPGEEAVAAAPVVETEPETAETPAASEPQPESEPEPEAAIGFETVAAPAAEVLPEPELAGPIAEPVAEPESVAAVAGQVDDAVAEPAAESASDAPAEPEVESEPEPVAAPVPEPKTESEPVAAPAPEPKTESEPVAAPAPEPKTEPEPVAAPAARPVEATLFDLEGTVSHRRRQRVILSLYGATGSEMPAPKPRSAAAPAVAPAEPEMPVAAEPAAPAEEPAAVAEPAAAVVPDEAAVSEPIAPAVTEQPAADAKTESAADAMPNAEPLLDAEPESLAASDAEPVPFVEEFARAVEESASVEESAAEASEAAAETAAAAEESAAVQSEPEPESAPETAPEAVRETLPEAGTEPVAAGFAPSFGGEGAPAPVLGDVINHDVQTLADTIGRPRDVVSELRRLEPVTDLERAIGINDKFLLIRDLFCGDAAAYDEAIATLNGFDDLDDCMIHIAEHYAWNPNSDGAKLLMELLERKFA